jgi:transcriptional regulator with XRE-family HTH domain
MGAGTSSRVEMLCRWFLTNHVTQDALAIRVEVNPSTMSQIVNRRCLPSLKVFARMVRETGLPPQALLDDLMGRGSTDMQGAMPANVTSLQVARFRRAGSN